MRRGVGFAARAIDQTQHRPGFRDGYAAMLTLTYADVDGWEPRHISDALKRAREWHKAQGIPMRYVWVAELQKRGALHYHLVFWMPHGVVMPKWDKDNAGWWPHGFTQWDTARNAVGYLLKYLSKGTAAHQFPKGARLHGCGGLEPALRRSRAWFSYPAFIKARASIDDRWRRAPGGGWQAPTGDVFPSEHARAWVGNRWGVVRIRDHGRPFDPAGPFSWLPLNASEVS